MEEDKMKNKIFYLFKFIDFKFRETYKKPVNYKDKMDIMHDSEEIKRLKFYFIKIKTLKEIYIQIMLPKEQI